MDTELARTFLAIVATGNFIGAAERLHVTQSTVSARIHVLEKELGCRLFVRNKAGAALTPAGLQFQRHAGTLVRTLEQARQDVGVPRGFRAALTVGGRFGLWESLLLRWLPIMRKTAPDVSVRAEIGMDAELMQGLVEGRLDIGVMYTPQSRPGLIVAPLLTETLILVSSQKTMAPRLGPGYVLVDWGPEFFARHGARFPEFLGPALAANIGWLALQHILANGGSGYFPVRLVEPHLAGRRLFRVPRAPDFALPAYIVHLADGAPHVTAAVADIRRLAAASQGQVPVRPRRRTGR